jgi:hypothetical protein
LGLTLRAGGRCGFGLEFDRELRFDRGLGLRRRVERQQFGNAGEIVTQHLQVRWRVQRCRGVIERQQPDRPGPDRPYLVTPVQP